MTINEKTNKFKYIKIKPDSVLFEKKTQKTEKTTMNKVKTNLKLGGKNPITHFTYG